MPDINEKGGASKGQKNKKQSEKDRVMGELKAAREALSRQKVDDRERAAKDDAPAPPATPTTPPEPTYIAQHKVIAGDTMSGLALKYYGSAVREKWMHIYEANKETIGENPAFIKVGQVLNIPEAPE